MKKIVIDDYSIYEIDEECVKRKQNKQNCEKENSTDKEKKSGIE